MAWMKKFMKIKPKAFGDWGDSDNRYGMCVAGIYEIINFQKDTKFWVVSNPVKGNVAYFASHEIIGPFTKEEDPEMFL